jgi:hypothetical protein
MTGNTGELDQHLGMVCKANVPASIGASTPVYDLNDGGIVIQAITGAITVAAPLFRGGVLSSDVVPIGTRYTFRFKNTTGGALVVTWNAIFKTGATPSIAANSSQTFEFVWDGTNWFRAHATAPTDQAN